MEGKNVNNESNPSLGSFLQRRRHIQNTAYPLNNQKIAFHSSYTFIFTDHKVNEKSRMSMEYK